METTSLAQKLIAECQQTKSKKLDLGYCGLREIPEEVFELVWLEELYLCNAYWSNEKKAWIHSNNNGRFNSISFFPDAIKGLVNLKILYAGGGEIRNYNPISWNIFDILILTKLTNLVNLNLQFNSIYYIPKEVEKLQNLTSLHIGANQIFEIPKEIGKLNNLTDFHIHSNNLTKIPPEIGKLNSLTTLGFSVNKLTSLPKEIGKLNNLTSLYLSSNELERIPKEIGQLITLTHLDLSTNKLSHLSKEIGKLRKLSSLNLTRNKLSSLPCEIGMLKELSLLHLHANQLKEIPSEFGGLKKLTSLDVSYNKIFKISSEIKALKMLEKLNLGENNLEQIPSEIGQLENLSFLDLRFNKLRSIPLEIGQLQNLSSLELTGNPKINEYSFLANLKNLKTLHLCRNHLTSIPKEIYQLKKLNHLNLRYNRIDNINFLDNLSNIKEVYLRENRIKEIPRTLLKHKLLLHLEVVENPINSIPNEIIAGTKWKNYHANALPDLRQWCADLAEGSIPNYYFKLLILGNGRVGKSCIVDALQRRPFDKNKESSHAINLEKWHKEPPITFSTPQYFIWDFGGQEIYHSTHKWFMRSRAVYLVIWDRTSEKETKIKDPITGLNLDNHDIPYWINTIRATNKNIPILLVESKLDKYGHKLKRLSEKELPLKFRTNVEFSRFSAVESDRYLRRLESDISMITESLDEYGQEMPLSWHKVRKRILDCIFTENNEVIQRKLNKTEFKDWCAKAEVLPKSTAALLRFLHRTGIIYTDEKLLGDTLLIDQQWAIDAIYKVLDRKSDFFLDTVEKKGRFPQRWLFKEWGNDYTEMDKQLFLQFMKSCSLCFQINQREKGKNNQYAIPQLMPELPPANVQAIWAGNLPHVYYLEFQYDFLHYGTVQDFIVKMGRKTNLDYIWKNGISIPWQDSQALVVADVPNKIIHVRTMGSHQTYLLNAIQNDFLNSIDKELKPSIRVSNDGLHFVELAELQKCQVANNENVEIINRETLTKSYLSASSFVWALQQSNQADLEQLPDLANQVELATNSNAPIVTISEHNINPFIKIPIEQKLVEIKKIVERLEKGQQITHKNQAITHETIQKIKVQLFTISSTIRSNQISLFEYINKNRLSEIQLQAAYLPLKDGLDTLLKTIPDLSQLPKVIAAKKELKGFDADLKSKIKITWALLPPILTDYLGLPNVKYEKELAFSLRDSVKKAIQEFNSWRGGNESLWVYPEEIKELGDGK